MREVGTFEAKTHLSSLLEKVGRGEEFLITKRGKPIARLAPVDKFDREKAAQAARELGELRKGVKLGGLSWKELRDEGHRWR